MGALKDTLLLLFAELTVLAARTGDPTRTLTLRGQYARAVRRRFVAVRRALRARVEGGDAFRVAPGVVPTIEAQVTAFLVWLAGQWDAEVLDVPARDAAVVTSRRRWQDRYVQSAYLRGVLDARQQLRQAGTTLDTGAAVFGGLLALPVHAEALNLLTTQAFADLQAITDATTQALRREAVTGLLSEETLPVLAARLQAPVTQVGIRRGEVLARTGVIAAVAQGTLTEAVRHGVTQVRAEVEYVFTTAGDARVCNRCADLAGRTFTITAARGVIPVHGRCRCKWTLLAEK